MEDCWQVVGGTKKGGLLVRISAESDSQELTERLATGSLVRQVALDGNRLQYELILGSGPTAGWVSTRLSAGQDLLKTTHMLLPCRAPSDWPLVIENVVVSKMSFDPISGRELRILALHGSGSNTNILKFQTARFRKMLGNGVKWLMPDGIVRWEKPLMPPGAYPNHWYEERSEVERMLAKDMPFKSWVALGEYEDGQGMDCIHDSRLESLSWFIKYVESEGPIDVVVAFSQGAYLVNVYLTQCCKLGLPLPWRLNIFFSPSPNGRFDKFQSPLPTLMVTSPKSGWEYELGLRDYTETYASLRVLEHEDGHAFPSTEPRASQIYAELELAMQRAYEGKEVVAPKNS